MEVQPNIRSLNRKYTKETQSQLVIFNKIMVHCRVCDGLQVIDFCPYVKLYNNLAICFCICDDCETKDPQYFNKIMVLDQRYLIDLYELWTHKWSKGKRSHYYDVLQSYLPNDFYQRLEIWKNGIKNDTIVID